MNDPTVPLYALFWTVWSALLARRLLWTPEHRRTELLENAEQLVSALRLLTIPTGLFRGLATGVALFTVAVDVAGLLLGAAYVDRPVARLCLSVCTVLWLPTLVTTWRTARTLRAVDRLDDPVQALCTVGWPTVLGDLGHAARLTAALLLATALLLA